MKTFISFLLALLVQGLFTGANAATSTFTIVGSAIQPTNLPAIPGSVLPMLGLKVSVSGGANMTPLYLAVQQTGSARWDSNTNSIRGLYLGDDDKIIGWGMFDCPRFGTAIVGPIYLFPGQTNEVVISASMNDDLSDTHGKVVGLRVTGALVDGDWVVLGDDYVFAGNFPILGQFHQIDTNILSGRVSIVNTTTSEVALKNTQARLAQFSVNVENVNLTLPMTSLTFMLANGRADAVRSVVVVSDGQIVLGPVDIIGADNTNAGYALFYTNLTLTSGSHVVEVRGVIGNQIQDGTTLHVNWDWSGPALDPHGYIIVPTIDNAPNNPGVTIRSSYPTFTFTRNLTVGSTGYDVSVLQRILGMPSTGYFGSLTEAAVKAFQIEHNIPSTGFVGPLTRAVLNSMDLSSYLRPYVSIEKVANGVTLSVSGPPATAFAVQGSADLRVWEPVGLVTTDESGVTSMTQPASSPVQFFRLATP